MDKKQVNYLSFLGKLAENKMKYEYPYHECISQAEKFEKNNPRESLYFYEEALIIAQNEKDPERQAYNLAKIGENLNRSHRYQDAKLFYNLFFEDRTTRLDFACQ